VRQACDVVVALGVQEDLGLVLQPPERLGVDDPIPIPLEGRPEGIQFLRTSSPAAMDGSSSRRAQALLFRLSDRPITPDQSFHGPMMTDL
jgi:hypothetical protein